MTPPQTSTTPPFLLAVTAWWRTFGRPPRIMGLDVARALAVLGMIGAHLGAGAEQFELFRPETWASLVHGRSSILFAVLAGVSIALMTGRSEGLAADRAPAARARLVGRGAVIFTIGLVLELLNTPIAVILTLYGVLYIVAIPFLRWSVRRLLIAAVLLAFAGPALLAVLRAVTVSATGPGLDLVLFGTYPLTVWMALVFAGMALGRMRLNQVRTAAVVLAVGVLVSALGYGAGALLGPLTGGGSDEDPVASASAQSSSVSEEPADVLEPVPASELDFSGLLCENYSEGVITCYPPDYLDGMEEEPGDGGDGEWSDGWATYPQHLAQSDLPGELLGGLLDVDAHSGGTAEILGSGGFAIAVIGLCLLVTRPLRVLLLPFAALGSMPLSAYSLHVLSYVALAGPGGFLIDESWLWLWSAVVLLVAATVWSTFWGQGPLERLTARAAKAAARGIPDPVPAIDVETAPKVKA